MKKRMIALLMTGLLAISMLAGCSSGSDKATESKPAEEESAASSVKEEGNAEFEETVEEVEKLTKPDGSPIKVGMNMGDLTNQIYAEFSNRCAELAEAQGVQFSYQSFGTDPGAQISIIENWIEGDYDAIIIQNNSDESVLNGVLEKAKEKGMLVVGYDVELGAADYNILADNYELGKIIGRMTGEWVVENYGDEPVQVMVLTARWLEFVIPRCDGMIDGVKEAAPNAEVIEFNFTGEAGGTSEDAADLVMTTYPNCVAMCGTADSLCLPAYEILKATGNYEKGDFGFFGCDASYDALTAISNEDLYIGTVFADTVGMVTSIYQTVVDAVAAGEKDESVPRVQYFPMTPIYASNLEDAKH